MTSGLGRGSAEEARRAVDELVGDLGRVAEVIASAPFLDQREIVRGLTHEIAIDVETMRGEIAFNAVPRLQVVSNNEEGPAAGAEGLSLVMAGARDATIETTTARPVVRKSFSWRHLRQCA